MKKGDGMLQKYMKENVVIITPSSIKKKLLEEASNQKIIVSFKIYTFEEIEKAFFPYCDRKSLYELIQEYKVSPSMGLLYLKQIMCVDEKEYTNDKLAFLSHIKQFLRKKGLLKQNEFLKQFLKRKKIIIYEYPVLTKRQKELLLLLKKENIVIDEINSYKNQECFFMECDTTEQEVTFVAEKIMKLLHENTPIDHIKLFLPSKDYIPVIHRIFYLFQIPYHLKEERKLISYDMAQYFLEILKETEPEEALGIIRETYDMKDPFLLDLYQKIVTIVNEFVCVKEKKLLYEILHTIFQRDTIVKEGFGITEISSLNETSKKDIVFALGMHTTSFPVIHRDDDYLSDTEKQSLKIDTSKEKNQIEVQKAIYDIMHTNVIYISFSHKSPFSEYARPSFLETLKKKIDFKNIPFQYEYHSAFYNRFLLARLLDSFTKYNQKNEELSFLYHKIKVPYRFYNHAYKPISKERLYSYLDHKMNLSYSSIDVFYRCKFRFFLSNILNIREERESSMQVQIGNIVHKVLFHVFHTKRSDYEEMIDEIWDEEFSKDCSEKIQFYKQKYRKEIRTLIRILLKQREQTDFKEESLEEKYEIKINGELSVTLKGYIDKVLTFQRQNHTYTIVVDYKTGTIESNFNPVIHGIHMQLLIYHYLLSKKISNYTYAGSYWQNIMKEILPAETGKTYEQIQSAAYKLNGYTLKNSSLIHHIDHNIENSYIRLMRMKADGEFYANAKVLTEDEVCKLLEITEKNIFSAIDDIEKANFSIDPKRIGSEKTDSITGCAFCPYHDICFMRPSDIVSLKEYKNLEFIKGGIHG